jgi:hypothetical protein
MLPEKIEKAEYSHNDDRYATQKDLRILSLEIDNKILELKNYLEKKILELKIELKLEIEKRINAGIYKLGALIVASSGIMFGLLTYFQK